MVSIHAPTQGATVSLLQKLQMEFVSIHAPTQGATLRCGYTWRSAKEFQSTRPRRARRVSLRSVCQRHACFNPRAHAGRDGRHSQQGKNWTVFQSTRPRRARRRISALPGRAKSFQSTRPRRARQIVCGNKLTATVVSIHAPTQGATFFHGRFRISELVSIHAPTQGATGTADGAVPADAFQSTRPRRARLVVIVLLFIGFLFQSTRPRRARRGKCGLQGRLDLFQSTRPRRARPCFVVISFNLLAFQSTRPRRARHAFVGQINGMVIIVSIHAPTQGATISTPPPRADMTRFNPRAHAGRDIGIDAKTATEFSFNPRAHAGRDTFWNIITKKKPTFQSTRPRRARQKRKSRLPLTERFQSTRPRRARHQLICQPDFSNLVSIHAPTQGATGLSNLDKQIYYVSIHAPTQGATGLRFSSAGRRKCFNPRAHAGRDTARSLTFTRWMKFQSTRPRRARHSTSTNVLYV